MEVDAEAMIGPFRFNPVDSSIVGYEMSEGLTAWWAPVHVCICVYVCGCVRADSPQMF